MFSLLRRLNPIPLFRHISTARKDFSRNAKLLSSTISSLSNQNRIHDILNLHSNNIQKMNATHVSKIFFAISQSLAKTQSKQTLRSNLQTDERFKNLLSSTISKLKTKIEFFDPRSLATITRSLSNLNIPDKRTYHKIFSEIVANIDRIEKIHPNHLSNICWSFANVGYHSDVLFSAVANQHERIAANGDVKALSDIAWSFATVGYKSEELFFAVAGEHERLARVGTALNLTNIAWAFATNGHKSEQLFDAVASQQRRIIETGTTPNLRTTCWAFSKLGCKDKADAMFEALFAPQLLATKIANLKKNKSVRQPLRQLLKLYAMNADGMDATHLGSIYGAIAENAGAGLAKNGPSLQKNDRFKTLLGDTIDKLQRRPEWFGVREIASIALSLGKLKISDERFFNEIVNLRERIAKDGNTQDLSKIAWACATVGYKSEELFETVAGEHVRLAQHGNLHELANVCWAFAKLGCKADELFGAVAGEHSRLVASEFSGGGVGGGGGELATILYAYAKAGRLDICGRFWGSLRASEGRVEFNEMQLRQLGVFLDAAKVEKEKGRSLVLEPAGDWLLERISRKEIS